MNINQDEINKFESIASEWWDKKGKFKLLHDINDLRSNYIQESISKEFSSNNLNILDIGCGGGILSESIAMYGYNVTAIDPSIKNINIAKLHNKQNYNLNIDYQQKAIEEMKEEYDIVMAMEVIEHVENQSLFVTECVKRVKKGGLLFMSTLNRTIKSYLLAIVGAEYIIRWLPIKTHNWNKFVKPHEIHEFLSISSIESIKFKGMNFKPLTRQWILNNNIDVNYIVVGKKS